MTTRLLVSAYSAVPFPPWLVPPKGNFPTALGWFWRDLQQFFYQQESPHGKERKGGLRWVVLVGVLTAGVGKASLDWFWV
jgi:hypothetical protein